MEHDGEETAVRADNGSSSVDPDWLVVGILAGMAVAVLGFAMWRARQDGVRGAAAVREMTTVGAVTGTSLDLNSSAPSSLLLGLRLSYLCFGLFVVGYDIHVADRGVGASFAFFTWWNYLVQLTYFACGAAAAVVNWKAPPEASAGRLGAVTASLLQLTVTCCLMVGITYWTLLFRPSAMTKNEIMLGIAEHGINVPVILLDLVLNRMSVLLRLWFVPITWLVLYATFATVFQLCGGFSPYFFSDISKLRAIPYGAGSAILVSLCHLAAVAVSRFTSRKMGLAAPRLSAMQDPESGSRMLGQENVGYGSARDGRSIIGR